MKRSTSLFLVTVALLGLHLDCRADAGAETKPIPSWPIPNTLRIVRIDFNDNYKLMTVAALQGLVNRHAPDGHMIYLEMRGFPEERWLRYYVLEKGLNTIETTISDLLKWAREELGIQHYIVVDPFVTLERVDKLHSCTRNIALTMAGIFGNAVPVHPDNIPMLEVQGYTLLPDSYCDSLGAGGARFRTPKAFDLRNQWKTKYADAPWATRRDAYRWALDTLLPLTDHHAVSLDDELPGKDGQLRAFYPWMYDYSVGTRLFHFFFSPTPPAGTRYSERMSDYDIELYRELLQRSGPMTMVRGWHLDEKNHINLISQMRCFHAGSRSMANASVHAAVSPLFEEPFIQRQVSPESVDLDADKIYLTFSITDGDQFGVVYRYYDHYPEPLWINSSRGKIPINWTMSGLMYHFGRGIMRWFFDNASPVDYFTADLPVGYGQFSHENFGNDLETYDAFANSYLEKSGLPVADFFFDTFPMISDPTVKSHVAGLTNAIAIRDGYFGGFYQGIYWPEERPLMPYIRNTYAAGEKGSFHDEPTSPEDVVAVIERIAQFVPWRPLFMHLTWINWYTTPTDMHECLNILKRDYPGECQLVGMPEFIALAQKAKLTGQYPMEFYPLPGGRTGLEGPYLWEDRSSTTSGREERRQPWRKVSGGAYFTYKFNVAPAKTASVMVEIAGVDYRMDASSDDRTWTVAVIKGSSDQRVTEYADLTPYLNDNGSVYIKFTGETQLWHVKVTYK